jgi:hypothetical protein
MAQSIGLLDHFSALRDPREQWRVVYLLPEVLLLLLCAPHASIATISKPSSGHPPR